MVSGVNTPTGPFVSSAAPSATALSSARFAFAAGDRLTLSVGLRGDFWKIRAGPADAADASRSRSSARASAWAIASATVTVQGAVYRAHRTPTLNELHRGFRVGNVQTNPNVLLEPEKLTGVEGGVLYTRQPDLAARDGVLQHARRRGRERHADDARPTLITRIRQNSDEIRARGLEIEGDLRPHPDVTINGADDLHLQPLPRIDRDARARGQPRAASARACSSAPASTWANRCVTAAGLVRGSSSQYDDDQNTPAFELQPVRDRRSVGVAAVRALVQGFFAVENLFDEDYDTGRTPLRTIGWPRTIRAGVRVALP